MKKSVVKKNEDDSKLFAFLVTFLSIIGFVIVLLARRDDKYVMFYAKQSLIVFIVAVLARVVEAIIFIPYINRIVGSVLGLLVFILWIFSWVYALSGKKKEVPIVGQFGRKFDF